ncbi:MAG: P-loop NTPase [Clostridia bacterium]|nr:P-loop NTPase [Clostridia bacterium]
MGKRIVILSGKGGVGKTTTAACVAGELAGQGHSTLLIDGDVALGNLDLMLGVEGEATHDLVDVLNRRCPLGSALLRISQEHPLWYLPLALSAREDLSALSRLPQMLSLLANYFDFVIVDCPAGLGDVVRGLTEGSDLAILVTTAEFIAARNARRAMQMLSEMGCPARLVVNRVKRGLIRRGEAPDIDQVIDLVGAQLIGVAEEDNLVAPLQNKGIPIRYQAASPAARQLADVARRLLGEQRPLRFD